jgi:hypothetical protein
MFLKNNKVFFIENRINLNGSSINLIITAKRLIIMSANAAPGFLSSKKYKRAPSPIIRGMNSLSSPRPATFPSRNIRQAAVTQKTVSNRYISLLRPNFFLSEAKRSYNKPRTGPQAKDISACRP